MFSGVGRAGRATRSRDLDPVGPEVGAFGGVVRDQPHPLDAELEQDLGRRAVLARVDREAEVQVRVDGVVAAVLQLVGLQFGRDADAAPLLAAQVHDDAAAGVCDGGHRVIELGAAVAPAGAEDVTSQALAVNADEHRVAAAGVAHDEGQVVDAVDLGPPRLAGERAMTRRQRRLGDLADAPGPVRSRAA